MEKLIDSLLQISGAFDSLNIPYAVMGGLAVRAYSIPRPTYDVDFVAAVARSRLPEVYAAVERLGYSVAEPYQRGWVDEVEGMPLVKIRLYIAGNTIDVDVFLAEPEFLVAVVGRRRLVPFDGAHVWLVSPEDLILLKLLASRPRDLIDIGDLFFSLGQLDVAYMRQWAERLGISERLERALTEHQE